MVRTFRILFFFISFYPGMVSSQNGTTTYCQGKCCGGTYAHYLSLFEESKTFETYYLSGRGNYFGVGFYKIEGDIIQLNFKTLTKPDIKVERISENDSLLVQFKILDNIKFQNVSGAVVLVEPDRENSFAYNAETKNSLTLAVDNPVTITLNFAGFKNLTYQFNSPGEYLLNAILGRESDIENKDGDIMTLMIKGNRLKGISNPELKFSSKGCY